MKIHDRSQVKYKVIDWLNQMNWLNAAISITLCGIALLWTIGLIFIKISY